MHDKGWGIEQLLDEIETRKSILQYMANNNIRDYESFTRIIHAYFIDPKEVVKNLKNDRLKDW